MKIETIYILSTLIMNGFLCTIWQKNGLLNLSVKITLGIFTFMGGYVVYTNHLLG